MTFTLNIRTAEERLAEHLVRYVASTLPEWVTEARIFVEWRDSVWKVAIVIMELDDLLSCDLKSLLAELPTWQTP
jgi:hypothetical protein